ncbi:hypothetical protein B5E41_17180 [Rhizobium esperanzae]|uniref:Uncharacterized protein n=1 Tax=Rhizobium esperanzae TaxID=1967781 RepID=A0A246DT67_9HYPH|nr:hypothetical protein B5E41_17180 [Rhizobium esperanzae]
MSAALQDPGHFHAAGEALPGLAEVAGHTDISRDAMIRRMLSRDSAICPRNGAVVKGRAKV